MVGSMTPLCNSVGTASTASAPSEAVDLRGAERQTVIIFDWDDTLMSSSWIDRMGLLQTESFSELSPQEQAQFQKLEEHAMLCLNSASKCGHVLIITNAEQGWVEYSAKRFMPRLLPIVQNMDVVSARSSYEKFYPNAPLCWKAAAFAHEANQFFSSDEIERNIHREIISIGDSNEERTAVKIASGQLGAKSKSIKFVELPNPEQLARQLETVSGWLKWVVGHSTELDLMLKEGDLENPVSKGSYHAADLSTNTTPWRPPPMASLDVRE